jgi:hypothetical protein
MNLKYGICLILSFLPSLSFAEPIASASYKDVCEKMEQEGVVSRTQSAPGSEAVMNNVVVVAGAGSRNSQRHNRPVSNSEIIVGANITEITTTTSATGHTATDPVPSSNPCR